MACALGLMRIAPSGQDIRFDEKQVEEGRNFATKLWNAARFRQMHGPSEAAPKIAEHALSIYAVEVLARLNETIAAVEEAYRGYRFSEVAQALYDFFWGDYCDWFVEAAKTDIFAEEPARKAAVLAVMDHVLVGGVAIASSIYASYHGGAVAFDGFRRRRIDHPVHLATDGARRWRRAREKSG